MAGQWYAAGAHHAEALKRAPSPHWREPFRLMASLSGHEGQNLFYMITLIDQLLSQDVRASVALGAEMLTEIGRRRLALRQFEDVLGEASVPGEKAPLWARARALISSHVEDAKLPLADRERYATVLATLGDPRFTSVPDGSASCRTLIVLQGGDLVMGSDHLKDEILATSGGFTGGQRELDIYDFKIGRYLVTNAEYKGFVDGDGYTNPDYWKGKYARGWLLGDATVLEELKKHWLATVHYHHAKEIRDGEIDLDAQVEEAAHRIALRQAPYYWFDKKFNQANQPVVSINWWRRWRIASGPPRKPTPRVLSIVMSNSSFPPNSSGSAPHDH